MNFLTQKYKLVKIPTIYLLGLLLVWIPLHTQANDSVARVGVGGLELLKTDDIQMVSEVLEISTAKIRVTYHFLNTSDKDIKTTVAFPMPGFERIAVGIKGNRRPLNSFQVFVDGKSVTFQKNRVFLVKNIDITDKLKKIGLSEKQIFDSPFLCTTPMTYIGPNLNEEQIAERICDLTQKEKMFAQLRKLETDIGIDLEDDSNIKETAYWEQTFPANKEIEVVHEYKPFVGFYPTGNRNKLSDIINLYNGKEACAGETFKSIKQYADFNQVYSGTRREVEYILGTGRNWKGPIKNFKLIIKKEELEEIVSLCFPGKSIKTNSTTVEFLQTNYVPQDKLIIYFYSLVENKL